MDSPAIRIVDCYGKQRRFFGLDANVCCLGAAEDAPSKAIAALDLKQQGAARGDGRRSDSDGKKEAADGNRPDEECAGSHTC